MVEKYGKFIYIDLMHNLSKFGEDVMIETYNAIKLESIP